MQTHLGSTSKVCAYCGTPYAYNPARPNQVYCQDRCRWEANRKPQTNVEKNAARDAKRAEHVTEFIAVDGEGIDKYEMHEIWDEMEGTNVIMSTRTHRYVLISVGEVSYHRNGEELEWQEIFDFLYSQKIAHPRAAFVGFFLGYDFAQWFKYLPASRGWSLFDAVEKAKRMPRNPEAKFPFPVDCKGWEFDILGMKRFKLRPHVRRENRPKCLVAHKKPELIEACASGKHNKHPFEWMYICDAGAYFQTSLMNAINPKDWKPGTEVVTPEELAILQEGKDNRSSAIFDEKMIEYNILENKVLARLMSTVNDGFVADNIRLKANQWFGPGQAAQAWLRSINVPTGERVRDAVPVWASEAARQSYYGGWFEIMMHGPVPGTTYTYDINSAYPYAIANLPCLLHGTWSRGDGKPPRLPRNAIQLVDARVVGRDEYIGSVPHRDVAGSILRPKRSSGWYWQHELDAGRQAGVVATVSVDHWVRYEPCACPPPVAAIAELYKSRLLVMKNSPFGKSKKLVYNSAYGKFAQSIGMPVFSNSVYASLITARCRTMILQAIATHPHKTKAVAMVATDSVTFLTPHPTLDIDKDKLGKWDAGMYENLSLMMPGLYWHDESREAVAAGVTPKLKSRGVSARDLSQFISHIDRAWRKLAAIPYNVEVGMWDAESCPEIEINVAFSVISPKLAVARNDWFQCGEVQWDKRRMLKADPSGKRNVLVSAEDFGKKLMRSTVYGEVVNEPRSTPYDKRFGDERHTFDEKAELSEWLTPDGDVRMEIAVVTKL